MPSVSANSHTRISRLFQKENAGVGLYENIWPDTLALWVAQGYPAAGDGRPADPVDVFGFDLGRVGAAFDAAPWPGRYVLLEQTEAWEIVENSAGVVEKRWRTKSAPPGHLSFRLTDRDVWESEFKPEFLRTDDKRIPVKRLRADIDRHRATGRWVCFNTSFIWENLRQAMGDVCLYESLIDDPAFIRDYNQTMLDFYIRHFERTFDTVGITDGLWFSEDLAYNQGLFCSPLALRELYLPFYNTLIDFLHKRGMKVILHSCGNITAALPIIAEAGFDGLHPLQIHAGCDPLRIAREYGDRLVLIGGLDTHLLEEGDHAKIRQEQIRLIHGMRDAGAGYIFSSDHSISTNVRYDTYLRVLETYHQYAGR